MPIQNAFIQNSVSDPYQYAVIRGVTTNFSSVDISGATTFLPPHKGFCVVTGYTSGSNDYTVPFDILYRNSNGVTFFNRVNFQLAGTFFFPVQISGISGNATYLLGDANAPPSLDQHLIYFYS